MVNVVLVFLCSLCLALVLTPLVRRIGRRYNIVDRPSERKVHSKPIPRIGGVAIFLSFYIPIGLSWIFGQQASLGTEPQIPWLIAGSVLVFLVGLADDFVRLSPVTKFVIQAASAVLAYMGGMQDSNVILPWGYSLHTVWFALPFTILWFLLVINAINLIDGLDGLATGVGLFTALVLLALSAMMEQYAICLGLVALAGACLGFLRYNFNPASIFLGDSGSYFIGYMLAALSLLGSLKSDAAVTILIPVIALGLPLIDTILAPVRRFLTGESLFHPDKSHIHHKLLQKGLTHRSAVLLMYCATVTLGILALGLVGTRSELHAYILSMLAVTVFVCIRKLGYFEYIKMDEVVGYIRDVADGMGLKKDKRIFLNQQVTINFSQNHEEMWSRIVEALQFLRIDCAELYLPEGPASANGNGEGGEVSRYSWCNPDLLSPLDAHDDRVLSINLPLTDNEKSYGRLILKKDLIHDWNSHYTLRRVEHLRRSIVRRLKAFEGEARGGTSKPAVDREPNPQEPAQLTVSEPDATPRHL
jgi:UDP-GlcNAc:undecaprenyl-phosphate/decaprenyl-phosphate GlcNAc-1-phosphate transferase